MENTPQIYFNSINNKSLKNNIPISENKIFNSILFLHLDSTYIKSLDNKIISENETSNNIEEDINKRGCFLIKDLIEQLDSIDSLEKTNDIENKKKTNLLLSLGKSGYEFYPKKYKNDKKANLNNENNIKFGEELFNKKNNFWLQKKTYNGIKERKGDWVCQNCFNLNFAFRTICNRCKGKKEECLQREIV